MLIEAKVDYSKSRNLMLSAIVLVVGISGVSINFGHTQLKGMVLATIVAMVLSLCFHLLDLLHLTNEAADTLDTDIPAALDLVPLSKEGV
jgi:uracil permease